MGTVHNIITPWLRSRATNPTRNNTPVGSVNHFGSPASSPITLPKPTRVESVIYAGKEPRYDEDGIRVERAVNMVIEGEELEV